MRFWNPGDERWNSSVTVVVHDNLEQCSVTTVLRKIRENMVHKDRDVVKASLSPLIQEGFADAVLGDLAQKAMDHVHEVYGKHPVNLYPSALDALITVMARTYGENKTVEKYDNALEHITECDEKGYVRSSTQFITKISKISAGNIILNIDVVGQFAGKILSAEMRMRKISLRRLERSSTEG